MDDVMAAQEHVALAWSLFDLGNNHQSDPAWLDKMMAAFAADSEVTDGPSGATLHGPDGHQRLAAFFAESFPDMRVELTNAFATEDQVTLECTWRCNDTGPLPLPSGALPSMRRSGELRCCFVFEFKLCIREIEQRLADNAALEASVRVNPPENARLTFDHVVNDLLQDMIDGHFKFYRQVNDDPEFAKTFLDWLFERYLGRSKKS